MAGKGRQEGRKIPEVLTPEEQAALLRQPNKRYPTGERNRLMLRLMLDTGLRLAEVMDLRWKDIDLNTGKLMVRQGKGHKDRTLWTGEDNLKQLHSWRERQKIAVGHATKLVFTTLKGGKLHPRYVQRMVKRYAAKAGIEKDITPHTLRHTSAMDLLRRGVDLSVIALWLGHESRETTEIYLHADMRLKEQALAHASSDGVPPDCYRPPDPLLTFLESL